MSDRRNLSGLGILVALVSLLVVGSGILLAVLATGDSDESGSASPDVNETPEVGETLPEVRENPRYSDPPQGGAGGISDLPVYSDPPGLASGRADSRSACLIDTRTIRTAQEAYFANTGTYAPSEATLVTQGFLSEISRLHDVRPGPDRSSYTLTVTQSDCGTVGHEVGQTPDDY